MTTMGAELKRLQGEGGFEALRKRFKTLDVDHQVPDGLGYNVEGSTRYIDRDLFKAILDGSIDTGLTPEQTVDCLVEHLETEKALADADNELDFPECVLLAQEAEDDKVRGFGGNTEDFDKALHQAFVDAYQRKTLTNPPKDLACATLLENPQPADIAVLKKLRDLDIEDAFKESRANVDYGKATKDDECHRCIHWQDDRSADLSTCSHVEGLVRKDRWCKRFEKENGNEPLRVLRQGRPGAEPLRTDQGTGEPGAAGRIVDGPEGRGGPAGQSG